MKRTVVFIIFFIFLSPFAKNASSQTNMVPFPTDWEKLSAAEFNLSHLLEKPAGKDGFIKIEEGHFVKPNGRRFRVWGVNLTGGACFPEKKDAPKVAAFLSAMGINAVRFHFLDSNWGQEKSIFDYTKNHTQSFHPEQIDKLDFFVAELKNQGIYSNFNLNVGRNYREGDNVKYHEYLGLAKGATLFDDRIIQLQKEYAARLLTHKNKYTGNEYRNEPALAFLEIVNENSLVEAWFTGRLKGDHNSTNTSTWSGVPKYYAGLLTSKYNLWLEKAISKENIEQIRKETGTGENMLIPRLNPEEFNKASKLRFQTEASFIIYTENAFYFGMYKYLKETLQSKQLIAANSDHNHYKSGYALLSNTSKLDFIDGHVYWQHPNYFTDTVSGKQTFSIENTPMVNNPEWSTISQLSRSAVEGKPYTISETNHPYPNQYACEGFFSLAAYALLQDWDGIYFYTLEHDDPSLWKTKRPNYFDIVHDPVKMSNLACGALIFHRADLKTAETNVIRNISKTEMIEGIRKDVGKKPFFEEGFDELIPLKYKTRLQFNSSEKKGSPVIENRNHLESDNKELKWNVKNNQGNILINTKNTQALIGYTEIFDTTLNLKVKLKNNFSAIVLTSLDGNAICNAEKLLLSTTASSILTGAKFNQKNNTLVEWGKLPFTIEPVTGEIHLRNLRHFNQIKIWVLDGGGHKINKIDNLSIYDNNIAFPIGNSPTVWYLIEIKR